MGTVHHLPVVSEWTTVMTWDPGMYTGWTWLVYDRRALRLEGAVDTILGASDRGRYRFGQLDIGGSPAEETAGAQAMARYIELSTGRAIEKIGAALDPMQSVLNAYQSGRSPLRRVVVCESFQLRQRTMDSSLLSPVRLQSKLEAVLAERKHEHLYVTQTPAEKSSVTDERLLRWGLAQPRHLTCDCHRHSNDAIRHLVVWLRKDAKLE